VTKALREQASGQAANHFKALREQASGQAANHFVLCTIKLVIIHNAF
jgi:hypothetical protein